MTFNYPPLEVDAILFLSFKSAVKRLSFIKKMQRTFVIHHMPLSLVSILSCQIRYKYYYKLIYLHYCTKTEIVFILTLLLFLVKMLDKRKTRLVGM